MTHRMSTRQGRCMCRHHANLHRVLSTEQTLPGRACATAQQCLGSSCAHLEREGLVLRPVLERKRVGGLPRRDLVVAEPDADPLQLARELPAAARASAPRAGARGAMPQSRSAVHLRSPSCPACARAQHQAAGGSRRCVRGSSASSRANTARHEHPHRLSRGRERRAAAGARRSTSSTSLTAAAAGSSARTATTFQSSSPSSIMANTASGLTAYTPPAAMCADPMITASRGSPSPARRGTGYRGALVMTRLRVSSLESVRCWRPARRPRRALQPGPGRGAHRRSGRRTRTHAQGPPCRVHATGQQAGRSAHRAQRESPSRSAPCLGQHAVVPVDVPGVDPQLAVLDVLLDGRLRLVLRTHCARRAHAPGCGKAARTARAGGRAGAAARMASSCLAGACRRPSRLQGSIFPFACRARLQACLHGAAAGGREPHHGHLQLGAALTGDLAHEADCAGAQVERDVVPGADGRACGPRRRVARLPAYARRRGAWRALTCQAADEQAVLERARLALRRAVQRAQPSVLRSFSRRGGCTGGHGCSHAPHAAHLHPGTTSWPACRCGKQGVSVTGCALASGGRRHHAVGGGGLHGGLGLLLRGWGGRAL